MASAGLVALLATSWALPTGALAPPAKQNAFPPDAVRLEQEVQEEELKYAKAEKEAGKAEKEAAYWKALGQKEGAELKEIMHAEHYVATAGAGATGDEHTVGARLTACLRTRDVVQMEGEKLRKENAALQGQAAEIQATKELINNTLSQKLADTAAEASRRETELFAEQEMLQSDMDKLKGDYKIAQEEQQKLQKGKQAAEVERDALKKQLAAMTKQHNEVVKAHKTLKEAHQVLQRRHQDMVKQHENMMKQVAKHDEEERAKSSAKGANVTKPVVNVTKPAAMSANMTEVRASAPAETKKASQETEETEAKLAKCQETVNKLSTQDQTLHNADRELRLAAFKQGEKEGEANCKLKIQNVTAAKDAALQQSKNSELKAAAEVKRYELLVQNLDDAGKARDEAETKLRQCRASREKTEVELQRVMSRTGEKSAFLQLLQPGW